MINVRYVYERRQLSTKYYFTSSKIHPEYKLIAKHYTEIDDAGNVVKRWSEEIKSGDDNH